MNLDKFKLSWSATECLISTHSHTITPFDGSGKEAKNIVGKGEIACTKTCTTGAQKHGFVWKTVEKGWCENNNFSVSNDVFSVLTKTNPTNCTMFNLSSLKVSSVDWSRIYQVTNNDLDLSKSKPLTEAKLNVNEMVRSIFFNRAKKIIEKGENPVRLTSISSLTHMFKNIRVVKTWGCVVNVLLSKRKKLEKVTCII